MWKFQPSLMLLNGVEKQPIKKDERDFISLLDISENLILV